MLHVVNFYSNPQNILQKPSKTLRSDSLEKGMNYVVMTIIISQTEIDHAWDRTSNLLISSPVRY